MKRQAKFAWVVAIMFTVLIALLAGAGRLKADDGKAAPAVQTSRSITSVLLPNDYGGCGYDGYMDEPGRYPAHSGE